MVVFARRGVSYAQESPLAWRYFPGQPAIGPSSDIYSLGAILYYLLTGRPPFQGQTLSHLLLQLQRHDPISPRLLNASVPVDLNTICLQCLQKNPAQRYPTAQALAQDLERWLNGQPIAARPVGLWGKTIRWCARNRSLAMTLSGLALAVFLGFIGILWQWSRAERNAHQTRVNLYAADISAASLAIQRGDLRLARQLLQAYWQNDGQPDLRGFEWRLLWDQCRGQQIQSASGYQRNITTVRFSADGQWLVTGSQDSTLRTWHLPQLTPAYLHSLHGI